VSQNKNSALRDTRKFRDDKALARSGGKNNHRRITFFLKEFNSIIYGLLLVLTKLVHGQFVAQSVRIFNLLEVQTPDMP
jgi:hypothetical protein